MASEITVTVALQVNKTYLQHSQIPGSISIDMSGTRCAGGAQELSTSHEVVNLNELTTANQGWAYFRNTSSTAGQSIALGIVVSSTFYPVIEMKPGEVAMFRLNTTVSTAQAIYAKSSSGTPVLQYWIAEN
jgi:hypothetical protein